MGDIKKITTAFSSSLDKVGAFSSQNANYDVLYLDNDIDITSGSETKSVFGDFLEGTKAKISSWGSKIVSITSEVTENAVNFIDEACTNISSNVKSVIDDVSDWASETKSSVENWVSDVGSAISTGAQNLWTDANAWWNASALPWIETAASTVWGVTKSVGATIAVGVQSLFEGVGEFGEAIVDFGALVGTGVASIVTGLIDGGQAIYGAITGNEWSSVTKRMWGGTMGFVSTKYVSGWFDALYDKTAYGRWLKDNAYGFDTVRAVGSGIGYVAGVVALTIATFGAGGAVAAGGAVSATTAAAATSAAQMAVTAAAAGIGKGTQDAWADGADLREGLAAGALNGIWEGLQFYIGGKINGLNLFGANGIVSSVGSSGVGTNILNSLARVVLDGVDGGLEGFVMPLLSTIYKDGYYDENGTYVEFFDKDNIFERYAEVFDDNGGWNTVLTQAAIGSASSLISEGLDLKRYFKDNQVISQDSEASILSDLSKRKIVTDNDYQYIVEDFFDGEFDIKFNQLQEITEKYPGILVNKIDPSDTVLLQTQKKAQRLYWELQHEQRIVSSKKISTIDSPVQTIEEVPNKTTTKTASEAFISFSEFKKLVEDFEDAMRSGTASDENALKFGTDALLDSFYSKNKYVVSFMNKLAKLKGNFKKFSYQLGIDSAWKKTEDGQLKITISTDAFNKKDYRAFFHESGHALFDLVQDGKVPKNWDDVLQEAIKQGEGNSSWATFLDDFQKHLDLADQNSKTQVEKFVQKKGFTGVEEWEYNFAKVCKSLLEKVKSDDMLEYEFIEKLQNNDVAYKYIRKFIDGQITAEELAKSQISAIQSAKFEEYVTKNFNNEVALADMIDAMYKGNIPNINLDERISAYSHGKLYYEKKPENSSFHEIIANFTSIKLSNNPDFSSIIRDIFGERFYNTLENTFTKMLN